MKFLRRKSKAALELSNTYAVFVDRSSGGNEFKEIKYGSIIRTSPFRENVLHHDRLEQMLTPFKGKRVHLLLPDGAFIITRLSLPELPADEEERREYVRFLLSRRFPFEGRLEIALWQQGKEQLLVAATSSATLRSYLKVLERLRIEPVSIQIASISSLNYLLSTSPPEKQFLFLDISRDRAVLLAYDNGFLRIYRIIRNFQERGAVEKEVEQARRFLRNEELKVYVRRPPDFELTLKAAQFFTEDPKLIPCLGALL